MKIKPGQSLLILAFPFFVTTILADRKSIILVVLLNVPNESFWADIFLKKEK
jgi:hypothetical protein